MSEMNEEIKDVNIEEIEDEQESEDTTEDEVLTDEEAFGIIEGLIFVSNEPIELKNIASGLGVSEEKADELLVKMAERYQNDSSRGIALVKTEGKYTFVTKKNIFKYLVKAYQGLEKPRITPSMLETLSIIAYKQPVTKLEIESIRGVNSDHVVSKLVEYELVTEVGRAEKIGRPILFGTTDKFLVCFGLKSIEDLPKLVSNEEGKEETNIEANQESNNERVIEVNSNETNEENAKDETKTAEENIDENKAENAEDSNEQNTKTENKIVPIEQGKVEDKDKEEQLDIQNETKLETEKLKEILEETDSIEIDKTTDTIDKLESILDNIEEDPDDEDDSNY